MNTEQLLSEIRETNLAYLLLAQRMVKADKASAMFRLGISQEVGAMLGQLSARQNLKMAPSILLLCRFRCDDRAILGLLADHGQRNPMAQTHAAVLMTGQPAV